MNKLGTKISFEHFQQSVKQLFGNQVYCSENNDKYIIYFPNNEDNQITFTELEALSVHCRTKLINISNSYEADYSDITPGSGYECQILVTKA